jgi:hypothetical protein
VKLRALGISCAIRIMSMGSISSFAAPIVSAILANLLSDHQTTAKAVSILDQASADIGVQNAVPVKQP